MSNTVTLQGNPVSVSGHFPVAGEQAKPFSLVAKDLSDVTLANFTGQRKILNIVPGATDEEKAKLRPRALAASRTNLLLSLPMLYCMVSANIG